MTTHLESRLSEALHDLAADAHLVHDVNLDVIERRGRRAKTRSMLTRTGATLAAAAVAVTAVGLATRSRPAPQPSAGGAPAPAGTAPADTTPPGASPAHNASLDRLASYVLADDPPPTGDATEVIRTTTVLGKAPTVGADLYADDGRYFYSDDPSGLGAQVRAGNNLANGVFGREVAIAKFAANGGDLATAERRMAVAALNPGTPYRFVKRQKLPAGLSPAQVKHRLTHEAPAGVAIVVLNNDDWSNCRDALIAGAGQPEVRAGVLRILSTDPEVSVAQTTTDGQATLTVTDTDQGYVESLVIGAKDAIPLQLTGTDEDEPSVGVTITYTVSRVTLADLAKA